MNTRKHMKLVHEGKYAAEIEIEIIDSEGKRFAHELTRKRVLRDEFEESGRGWTKKLWTMVDGVDKSLKRRRFAR
jgi:hypothetical protein